MHYENLAYSHRHCEVVKVDAFGAERGHGDRAKCFGWVGTLTRRDMLPLLCSVTWCLKSVILGRRVPYPSFGN